MDYYTQIFKRKSFHLFKEPDRLVDDEIHALKDFIKTVKPLNPDIRTEIDIVPENETSCKRGGEFCILFYSETKNEYFATLAISVNRLICILHQRILELYGLGLVNQKS